MSDFSFVHDLWFNSIMLIIGLGLIVYTALQENKLSMEERE